MPLGIVSDEEFNKEVECIHKDIVRGRGHKIETPEVIREIIAEKVISGEDRKDVAKEFGVSDSSVSAYKNGATSTKTYHEPDSKLQKRNDEVRNKIIGTARSRLLSALSHITSDKLAEAKLRDIASVAKDMSAVIHNTEPQVSSVNNGINAKFIFHVPIAKKESDFEVIDVAS